MTARRPAAVATAVDGRQTTVNGYLPTVTGDPRWWESTITPLPGAVGGPKRLLVISRDVTAQREAERARRWSEKQYRTLVEATSQIVAQGYFLAKPMAGVDLPIFLAGWKRLPASS